MSTTTIYDIYEAKGAKNFLDSKGRNSVESKKAYAIGLLHFQRFLDSNKTLDSIIKPLSTNEINVYELLNEFVSYLIALKLTPVSIRLYMSSVRSYLEHCDIDIVPSKFKRKVTLPKVAREDEEAIDTTDIRKILLSCSHRRLKSYLLLLASGGMRAVEALAIRLRDIDFSVSPTKIHIRKEYAKTRVGRDIYISDEATQYLKQWIDFKYRSRERNLERLVFAVYDVGNQTPSAIYNKIDLEFNKVLDVIGFGERKEGMQRRKITLHSLRRNAKGVISDQAGQDYSEWFLGHAKSSYWTKKEPYRREIYATKCMKYLTFLDYTTLEATGKNIEAKLSEKEMQIQGLEEKIKSMEESQRQSFEEFRQENRHIIAEAMAKFTAQLPKKAFDRFHKPIRELLEEG
jgi:integrase